MNSIKRGVISKLNFKCQRPQLSSLFIQTYIMEKIVPGICPFWTAYNEILNFVYDDVVDTWCEWEPYTYEDWLADEMNDQIYEDRGSDKYTENITRSKLSCTFVNCGPYRCRNGHSIRSLKDLAVNTVIEHNVTYTHGDLPMELMEYICTFLSKNEIMQLIKRDPFFDQSPWTDHEFWITGQGGGTNYTVTDTDEYQSWKTNRMWLSCMEREDQEYLEEIKEIAKEIFWGNSLKKFMDRLDGIRFSEN